MLLLYSCGILKEAFYIWCIFHPFSCFRNELHAIVDEVYMLTVFDDSISFQSVLGVDRYNLNPTSA